MPARTVVQPPRYTSQGVPLEQVEREQREAVEKKRYMERKVKNIVANGFLENGKFYLMIMGNMFFFVLNLCNGAQFFLADIAKNNYVK